MPILVVLESSKTDGQPDEEDIPDGQPDEEDIPDANESEFETVWEKNTVVVISIIS